eukprot:XP_028353947.1 uncharacterized protein LOC114487588 [Physeter catodon]
MAEQKEQGGQPPSRFLWSQKPALPVHGSGPRRGRRPPRHYWPRSGAARLRGRRGWSSETPIVAFSLAADSAPQRRASHTPSPQPARVWKVSASQRSRSGVLRPAVLQPWASALAHCPAARPRCSRRPRGGRSGRAAALTWDASPARLRRGVWGQVQAGRERGWEGLGAESGARPKPGLRWRGSGGGPGRRACPSPGLGAGRAPSLALAPASARARLLPRSEGGAGARITVTPPPFRSLSGARGAPAPRTACLEQPGTTWHFERTQVPRWPLKKQEARAQGAGNGHSSLRGQLWVWPPD